MFYPTLDQFALVARQMHIMDRSSYTLLIGKLILIADIRYVFEIL